MQKCFSEGMRQKAEGYKRVELRYHEGKDQYYIQIQDGRYHEIDKTIKHMRKAMDPLKKQGHMDEWTRLNKKYQRLIEERKEAVRYVEIAWEDIPEGVRARPIKKIKGQEISVTPQEYQDLLERLKKRGETLETDMPAPAADCSGASAADAAGCTGACAG